MSTSPTAENANEPPSHAATPRRAPKLLAVLVVALGLAAYFLWQQNWCWLEGNVTLNNEPLTRGLVTFHPIDGGAVSYGHIGPNGHYQAQTGSKPGLAPGEYIVTVAANEPPADDPEDGTLAPPSPLLTPAKLARPETSNLRVQVSAGQTTYDIPLKIEPAEQHAASQVAE